jgi:hypothetical protein
MRSVCIALALTVSLSAQARAGDFEALAAGFLGAVILNAYLNDPANKPAPVAPLQAPTPKSKRERYIEMCQGHGFKAEKCADIWDDKKPG